MRMSVCYFEDDSSISWDRRIMSFGQRMSLMGESYGYPRGLYPKNKHF